jgi:hypothetical protein
VPIGFFAASISPRGVDEHPDLAGRSYHVLADGLLFLKTLDDVLQPLSATDILVFWLSFAFV